MQIASVEPIAVRLPMRKPVVMAGEEVHQADNVLVRIAADNGVVGWGEAASAPLMTGETVASMIAAVRYLAPLLLDREAADIAGATQAMDLRMYGNHGAKAAIEIALHDLVGRAAGVPVHALLGEQRRTRVPLLGMIGGGDFDGDVRDAQRQKQEGYTIFKIKVGIDAPERDARRARAICAVIGGGSVISADANQGFRTDQAIEFVHTVDGTGLDFFEQPVIAHDLAGMAAVAEASNIAVGADEGIHSLDDIRRHHACMAAHGVSLKAIKLGGLLPLVEAGRLCSELGMAVNIACKTGEAGIACAAALHAASVIPAVDWGMSLTNTALREDIISNAIGVARGHADVPQRPGLGVDVDEARVARHRIDVAEGALA
jgi:muconate cycloisomerase